MSDQIPATPLESQTRGHHPDSPSSLTSSEACPQFENEQRDSEASRIGTLQHLAAETRDLSILENEEQVAAVEKVLSYEGNIVQYFRDVLKVEPVISREKYLAVGDEIVRDKDGREWKGVTGGFPDEVIYSLTAGEAHVPDWKFGRIPVEKTATNVQGWSYALGVFQLLGPRIKTVVVHFYAPYQGFTPEEQDEFYVCAFTRDDIPRMELRIRTIIARKKDQRSKATPKVDNCLWCAKKGSCVPLHNVAIQVSPKYPEFTVPAIVDPAQLRLPSQWADAIRFADQFTLWAKALKQRAADMVASEGFDVPGFVLRKKVNRTIESIGLFRSAAKKNGVSDDEFEACSTVSITAVEDAVKAKAPKGKGAAAVRQLASDLQELGATGFSKPSYYLQEAKTPAEKAKELQ